MGRYSVLHLAYMVMCSVKETVKPHVVHGWKSLINNLQIAFALWQATVHILSGAELNKL